MLARSLYRIEAGDLLFSNVFAWEGAIAIAQPTDAGRFGSHRIHHMLRGSGIVTAEFLRYYFLTDDGMLKIGEASPGGAGRNRTLGLEKLMAIEVPVPPLAAQQTFDRLQADVAALKAKHAAIRQANAALQPATLERRVRRERVVQFITHGPDIPDALLQAHEDGRVVFFCGAGISYPAGLPDFKGLVDEIYRRNGTAPSDIERAALDRGQYDATLDLLERRLPGQRLAVRRALAEALKPKLRRKGATDTQAALLRLARDRDGALRLVTTNFDRVFHVAAKRSGQVFQADAAPMLPIPKNSRWNGLVYLHGLLPEKADDTALNRLVVTSGDFGLAYLTERWAARFVGELFRNYVVCFVGYSINDPVLRYMMDALAADRMLGEVTPQAWALGDCEPGQEAPQDRRVGSQGRHADPVPRGGRHARPFSAAPDLAGLGRDLPRRCDGQGAHRGRTCLGTAVGQHTPG